MRRPDIASLTVQVEFTGQIGKVHDRTIPEAPAETPQRTGDSMFIRMFALAAACALTATALPAAAQDASQTANFGEISLRTGFTPDPQVIQVVAGGSIDASRLGGACVGKISTAPDFQLTYTAGSLPLAFRTRSSEDTTLVINGPDGSWSCDDDSSGDSDAQVVFRTPESGVYDVWIGTYGDSPAVGSLIISETP